MQGPDPIQMIFYILRVVPVIVLIGWIGSFYIGLLGGFEDLEIHRVTNELAENIMHYNLTKYEAVFNPEELARYDNSLSEPYVRDCRYGYYLEIKSMEETVSCDNDESCKDFCMDTCGLSEDELDGRCMCIDNVCNCRKTIDNVLTWKTSTASKFGYNPTNIFDLIGEDFDTYNVHENVLKRVTKDYYVSIADGDTVKPAKMTLTVFDTWLTEISCLLEKAYYTGDEQRMKINCLLFFDPSKNDECWLSIRKSGDNLCVYYESSEEIIDVDCRELPEDMKDIDISIDGDDTYKGKKTLLAEPSKENGEVTSINLSIATAV